MIRRFAAAALLSVAPLPATAQAGGGMADRIVNDPRVPALAVYGLNLGPQVRDDKGVQFGKALRIPLAGHADFWRIGVLSTTLKPVKKGDRIVIAFWARAAQTRDGAPGKIGRVQLEVTRPAVRAIFEKPFDVSSEWKMYQLAGTADADYPAGALNAALHLDSAKQVLEIGPVFILDYGRQASVKRRVAALGAALALAGAGLARNPQFRGADPHALFIGDELWVFPTGGPGGSWAADRFGAFSSRDLKTWRSRGEILRRDRIRWIGDDGARDHFLWAPGVVTRGGKWFLYYSVGPQNPTPSRIGVAVADRPQGPYRDSGRPLVTGGDGFEAIDPMAFVDSRSGKAYLYAGGSAGATLRVWELTPDMVGLARQVPVDQPPDFTEGAFMHERNGVYYLSYSHGRWNGPDYSVHYATAASPIGPWRYRGTILTSDTHHQGPGHHSFVRAPDGGWLVVYHRWEQASGPAPFKGEREVAIDRIRYAADGSILPVTMTDGAAAPMLGSRPRR